MLMIYYVVAGIINSVISLSIRNKGLPIYVNLLSGLITTTGWMLTLKYSQLSLVSAGAIFDVLINTGYYIGLYIQGEQIKLIQVLGIFVLFIGLYLINK